MRISVALVAALASGLVGAWDDQGDHHAHGNHTWSKPLLPPPPTGAAGRPPHPTGGMHHHEHDHDHDHYHHAHGTGGSSGVMPSPVANATASAQSTVSILTTEIVYTTVTSCPVTKTHHVAATSGSSESIEVYTTVSTIFITETSTICTECVAPPTPAANAAASPAGQGATSPQQQQQLPGKEKVAVAAAASSNSITNTIAITRTSTQYVQTPSASGSNCPLQATVTVTMPDVTVTVTAMGEKPTNGAGIPGSPGSGIMPSAPYSNGTSPDEHHQKGHKSKKPCKSTGFITKPWSSNAAQPSA